MTIQRQKFEHLLYHFVLTYSNWEHVSICPSESWESLSYGLQMALQALGGVPQKHRSDSLSAAVKNLKDTKEFTKRYQALLLHYDLSGQKTNPRSPNENGDAEQGHHRLKNDMEQALILRSSRDFESEAEYREFLDTLIAKRNAARQEKLAEEKAKLKPLPTTLFELSSRFQSRVSRNSTIRIKNNSYSVPSRLIGEQVIVRLYADRLEVFYGDKREETIPRLLGRDGHRIQYRHIIEGLLRKPGAFMQYVYREDLYPSLAYRQAYDAWQEQLPGIPGVKQYLRTLKLAADEGEQLVEDLLIRFLHAGQPFHAKDLAVEIRKANQNPSSVIALFERQVEMPPLDEYNQLLSEACV